MGVEKNYGSRLRSRQAQKAKRNTYLLLAGSIVTILLLVTFGTQAVFGLTGLISGVRHGGASRAEDTTMIIPSQPQFIENFSATKSASITLSGRSDSETEVEIYQNDRLLGTATTDEMGKFEMIVDLEKNTNTFSAVAISKSGGKSPASDNYSVRLLTGAPKLDLTNPKEGDTVRENPLQISGSTDPDNTVIVNEHLAIVSGTGNFNYIFQMNNGENKIKITARDEAGNETVKEVTIKYEP